jgi:hypothetical protein
MTDNVLVSRAKLETMEGLLLLLTSRDIACSDNTAKCAQNVLDMRDFVESEADVVTAAVAISEAYALRKRNEPMVGGKDTYLAQAAINALQYKGGE